MPVPSPVAYACADALRAFVGRYLGVTPRTWAEEAQALLDSLGDEGYEGDTATEIPVTFPTKIDGKPFTLRPRPPADWWDQEVARRGHDDNSLRFRDILSRVGNETAPLAHDIATALLWAGFDGAKLPAEADDNALLHAAGTILSASADHKMPEGLHDYRRVELPPLRPENIALRADVRARTPWTYRVTFGLDHHTGKLLGATLPDRKDTGVSGAKLATILRRIYGLKDPKAADVAAKKAAGAAALTEGDVVATKLRFHNKERDVTHVGWLANGAPYYRLTTNAGGTVYHVRRASRTPGAKDYSHATAIGIEERIKGRSANGTERAAVIQEATLVAEDKTRLSVSLRKRAGAQRDVFARLRAAGDTGLPTYLSADGHRVADADLVDGRCYTPAVGRVQYTWIRVVPGKELRDSYTSADYGAGTPSKWEVRTVPGGLVESRYDVAYRDARVRENPNMKNYYRTEWGPLEGGLTPPGYLDQDAARTEQEVAALRAHIAAYVER